jgi:hypothetical protein
MRKILLALILFFSTLSFAKEVSKPQAFIILNVENILLDKVPLVDKKPDLKYIEALTKRGYLVQDIEFQAKKKQDKRLLLVEDDELVDVSETLVIRPAIKQFLEQLSSLSIKVNILICSRRGDVRGQSLVDNLKLDLGNKAFKDVVEFVSKEKIRVEIRSGNGYKVLGKSAWDFRQKYKGKFGAIKANDYVILIDQLEDHQFIYSDPRFDMNLKIPSFSARPKIILSFEEDKAVLDIALDKIRSFITHD